MARQYRFDFYDICLFLDKNYLKPTKLPAIKYILELLQWVRDILDDPEVFVTSGPFPRNFHSIIKQIWKRLARIYFHLYREHWDKVKELEAESHVSKVLLVLVTSR